MTNPLLNPLCSPDAARRNPGLRNPGFRRAASGLPSAQTRGYLSLILHAHLPYVRHPEYEEFYEERWLFEALSECYIPLLTVFERLAAEAVPFRLTLSISPTLAGMLQDPLLQDRYRAHLDKTLALCTQENRRTRHDPALQPLAQMYTRLFEHCRALFEHYHGNLLTGFRALQAAGHLELITCAATHAYLPLWRQHPHMVHAQLALAAQTHQAAFGAAPSGIWLPECGYYPGLEHHLKNHGFHWFIVDTHGLRNASEAPRHDIYAPLACPNRTAAFGRDPECSQQVWSADSGYPGDPFYRDFYRDIGFDLPLADIAPYILDRETRIHTGIKYHRITTRNGGDKAWYEPALAAARAQAHAEDFVARCRQRVQAQGNAMPPLLTAPYDAELFGHWWFEGPQWLEAVLRRLATDDTVALATPGDYLATHGDALQIAVPSASSWGEEGYNRVWLNPANDWLYPHLYAAARDIRQLARDFAVPSSPRQQRALNQAGRSLLLAQASDWAFMLKNGVGAEYARQRVEAHLARFAYLASAIRQGGIPPDALQGLEMLDNVFPDLDYRVFG